MKKYESIIIAKPNLNEEEEKKLITKIETLIKENGELIITKNMGRRKLAYEIKKNKEGLYIVFTFKSKSDFISELERVYRITDDVIKFIVVRMDD